METCGCGQSSGGFLLAQPPTLNGSPETIVARGVREGSKVTGDWSLAFVEATKGKTTAQSINDALRRVTKHRKLSEFAEPAEEGQVRGALLGASDAHAETLGSVTEVVTFKSTSTAEFAAQFVLDQEILTDSALVSLEAAGKRQAFQIAGITNRRMLEVARAELARQVREGNSLVDFHKFVKERMISSGFTPRSPSHVETIFRTNVMKAYNNGRAKQMSQPIVKRARPFWQILTVSDGRQRSNHAAVNNLVLLADDPAWREAYPPFGFNCRCRVRSLPASYSGIISPGSLMLGNVPDPGFRSGLGSLAA